MHDTPVICTFDSTFDGFLSVVHYTVKNRLRPFDISPEGEAQLLIDSNILYVPTDPPAADVVRRTLCDTIGFDGFRRAHYVFLCADKDSIMTSYTYILYALKYGKKLYDYRSLPDINKAYALEHKVSHEADRMKGFLRFSVMENGVQYASMEPDNDVLALLMPHFADRLKSIPFVIHDVLRKKAGVCARGTWFITQVDDITLPRLSPDEPSYRELWKKFYSAISIEQRKNPRLQTQMMPKKYRKHMTEHQP